MARKGAIQMAGAERMLTEYNPDGLHIVKVRLLRGFCAFLD